MTPAMHFALAMWLLLVLGYLARKKSKLHIFLTSSAMCGDFGLVLYLEWSRHALETAARLELSSFQLAHVIASSFALLLYIPTAVLGIALACRPIAVRTATMRAAHRGIALAALLSRSLGAALMFSMIE